MDKAYMSRSIAGGSSGPDVLKSTENATATADSPLKAALLHNKAVLVNNMRARTILAELVKDRVLKEANAEEIRKIGKGTNIEMNEGIIGELYSRGDLDIVNLCRIIRRNGQDFIADLVQDNVTSDMIHIWDPASRKLGNHWKRIAQELQTSECIPKIQDRYPDDVRAQALYWLLEWEKRDAVNATAKTLAEVLHRCGMRKAAAFVKKLNRTRTQTKKRKRGKSAGARRKSPSRSSSAPRSRSALGPSRQLGSAAGMRPVKSAVGGKKRTKRRKKQATETNLDEDQADEGGTKAVRFEDDLVKRSLGEMRIHVTVDKVVLPPIPKYSEDEVIATFLDKVLHDRQLSTPTRYAIEGIHPSLSVDDVMELKEGNATFIVNCRTLNGLDALWDRYGDGDRLLKLIQKTLVTEQLLKEINTRDITLRISVGEEEFHVCREELLAAAAAGLSIPMSYAGPKKDVMEQLKKQYDKYKVKYREAIEEYNKFELNMTNFVSALKRIKPPSVQKVASVFMVEKYYEICTSKTTNMKRAIGTFINCIATMKELHDNARENLFGAIQNIRPEVETDVQNKCRNKVKGHLDEWEMLLDPQCDISQITIHQTAKECTPTPDLLALRPVLSLLPTLFELASKLDRRVDLYIKDDANSDKM